MNRRASKSGPTDEYPKFEPTEVHPKFPLPATVRSDRRASKSGPTEAQPKFEPTSIHSLNQRASKSGPTDEQPKFPLPATVRSDRTSSQRAAKVDPTEVQPKFPLPASQVQGPVDTSSSVDQGQLRPAAVASSLQSQQQYIPPLPTHQLFVEAVNQGPAAVPPPSSTGDAAASSQRKGPAAVDLCPVVLSF